MESEKNLFIAREEEFGDRLSPEKKEEMKRNLEDFKTGLEKNIDEISELLKSGQNIDEEEIDRLEVELSDLKEQVEGIVECLKSYEENEN